MTMRLPIRVFDLFLAEGAPPAAQFLDEGSANRAVQFLKQVADGGQLLGPDGAPVAASGIHYAAATRTLDVPYPTLRATRAAGLLVDDDVLQEQLQAQLAAGTGAAADPDDAPLEGTP